MTDCRYCVALAQGVDSVYEDESVVALMPNKPWAPGHIIVIPRQHAPIVERLDDSVVARMYVVANKLGVATFQATEAQGTTLLLNNGVGAGQKFSHVMMHVFARKSDDVLDFSFEQKQLAQNEASEVLALLRDSLMPEESPEPEDPDWWILDQLTRIP